MEDKKGLTAENLVGNEKERSVNAKNKQKNGYKFIIGFSIVMALVSVSTDSYVYNLNEKSNKLSEDISLLKSEKENLELQISKAGNVQNLMDISTKELNMKYAQESDYIKIDKLEFKFQDE